MTASASGIDFDFRPKTYFWPLSLETHLRATVRGAKRRAALERHIAAGTLLDAHEVVLRDVLTAAERLDFSRIHPAFMGGEFLADRQQGEVEIARITIKSTTWDVTSVYARQEAGLIYCRVVDEYEGQTLTDPIELTFSRPLTLGQLNDFFLRTWRLDQVMEANFSEAATPELALNFSRGESAFYPQFGQFISEEVEDWVDVQLYKRAVIDAEDEDLEPPSPPVRRGRSPHPLEPGSEGGEVLLARNLFDHSETPDDDTL